MPGVRSGPVELADVHGRSVLGQASGRHRPRVPAASRPRNIDHYLVRPRPQRRASLKPVEPGEEGEPRFLYNVLGGMDIRDETARRSQHARRPRLDHAHERRFVTGP
jgi:hypothetical protein